MIQSATAGRRPASPRHQTHARKERSVKILLPNALKEWWSRTTAEWTAEIMAEAYAKGYAAGYPKGYARAYENVQGISYDEAYAAAKAK